MLIVLVGVVSVLFLLHKWINGHHYHYWMKKGVVSPKTTPFFGNMKPILMRVESPASYFDKIYKEFEPEPYVGIYKIGQPALFLRDPELIKLVLIKDFANFVDNDIYLTPKDILFSQNPFMLRGEKWKTARAQITPSLTPVKLKGMFELIEDIGNKLVNHIDGELDNKSKPHAGFETKILSTKFTTDNFMLCAFGINGKSFENPTKSDLYIIAHTLINTSGWQSFKDFCILMKPMWSRILQMKFFSNEIIDYITSTVKETLQYRSSNNIIRNDFFDIMNATVQKVHASKSAQEYQLAVHAATLYIDGVETSGIALAFALYELGKHQDVQEKLRGEIQELLEKSDNKWSYENLLSLETLDCIIAESLRLHPPLPLMTRVCNKQFTFPKTNGNDKELTVEAGTPIVVPISSLHYDAQYYPNPIEFDPERFREGLNKLDLPKCTYMPFGEGPRICIGRRYAQLQLKIGIAKIVSKFKISVSAKTRNPLEMEKIFFLTPIGGLWLNFERLQ